MAKGLSEKSLEDWQAELEKDVRRWHEIAENGCSDPFWPDGVNMNLKRNHIIYDLEHIYELERKPKQMSIFEALGEARADIGNDPRIPPKVANDYMVRPRKLL